METKKTILLVDDDPDQLSQLKFHVERFGYQTLTASGQKEGEEMIAAHKPDLAIVDLMMEKPDSGFILSYRIKQKYPDVPVIIATSVTAVTGMTFSLDSEEDKHWIKADKYIEKGIRPDQLNREIKKLLKL
ncbi:MAG: response regulator [Bacteroidales bacterium]|nr:response regulator [Bacteroidales bacterium]